MEYDVTHGDEGPRITITLTPTEARTVHADLKPTLDTSAAFDKIDATFDAALRLLYGRSYRKGAH